MWHRHALAALIAAYSAVTWLAYQGAPGAEPATEEVRHGMRVWQQRNCASCHQLYGLGGYMGPDLTNALGAKGEARIRTFVRYGTGRMPAQPMSDQDMDALVAFLAWVDRSGQSRVPADAVHWTGTYLLSPP